MSMDGDKTCGTCIWNDDLLCDRLGLLVNDDDPACGKHQGKSQYEPDKEEK